MIPVKIVCDCGQKYAFEVEPIAERINQAVQCPICGTDGTTAANQLIAEHLALIAAAPQGMRLSGQSRPVTFPLPRRIPNAAHRDSDSFDMKARSKCPRLILGGAIVSLLVVGGAVVLVRGNPRRQQPAPLLTEATVGLPNTLTELNAWYVEPPVGQNAATLYLRGFNALQLANIDALPMLGKGQLPPLGTAMPAVMKSTLATLVESNQAALRLFSQGREYIRSRYPVDLTLGYDALYPHCKQLDLASAFLELTAVYHAEANQPDKAAKDILIGLALANSFLEEPDVLPQLTRTWSVGYAVGALEKTVNRTALPAEASAELAKVFQKMESSEAQGEGFRRAMVGARVMSLAALSDPQQLLRALSAPDLKMPDNRRSQITSRLQSDGKLIAERDFFENCFSRLMAARRLPFPARLKSDELGRQLVTEALDRKLVVLDLLLPSLGRRTTVEAECLAQLRLGWTAVALEQFRAAHGEAYPVSLSELTPEYLIATPVDPFDDQPLRYEKKGRGYMLYSIGPDLKDNSGQRKHGKDGDIVFAVISPTPRR